MLNSLKSFIHKKYTQAFIKVFVWDFDGTLYHSLELGKQLKNAYYQLAKSKNKKLSIDKFDKMANELNSWDQVVAKICDLSSFEVNNYIEATFDKTKYIKKDESIVSLVEKLSEFKHIILSNSSYPQIKKGLKKLGFPQSNHFKEIFSREKTKVLKPDLKTFQKVLNYTRIPAHKHLMIGDSVEHDLRPAKKIGMKAINIHHFKNIWGY